ncbi:hypothetical protein K9857_08590 [Pseudomonas sp. REP124]|uniref:hypothetical protein n=1 Tax=Pseudomonas sp. REP124 TaxID=2875731 RepID=UPI001CCCB8B5|nr:hypothetical protein [Pseudomonas sp. REP124]MBZ9781608.1 hypothetical protein [Pseudomonas sp. REP124]
MDGLLDFVKTPEGQGLLSAAFGGLAGARRGAPVNTLGIAGLAGINGYSDALQRDSTAQYRNMQAQQIQSNLTQRQRQNDWLQQHMPGSTPVAASGNTQPAVGTDGVQTFPQPDRQSPIQIGGADGYQMPSSPGSPSTAPGGMPQRQKAQGEFPLSLTDIMTYQMLGMDGGGTLLDLYKQANNPQERKSGNYYIDPRTGQQTYMPKVAEGVMMNDQGQAVPVPGAAQANAGYKGSEAGSVAGAQFPFNVAQKQAEQRGAAGYDPVKVVGSDGNEYWSNRLSVSGGGTASAGQGNGQGPFMAGRNPVAQEATKGLNNDFISNSYRTALDAGKAAQDMNGNITAMRTIPIETGWGSDAKAAAANVLTSLGVAPKNAELFGANAQKYRSVAMSQINKQLQDNKGTQTEGDAARALQTFASLEKTPMANAYILDLAQAKNNSAIRKADYYEKAVKIAQERGLPLSEVDAQYRKVQQSIWADPVMARWLPQGKR